MGCSSLNKSSQAKSSATKVQKGIIAHGALNPIVPPGVYIADPEPRVMPDGRIYVYGSRDVPRYTWCSKAYHVLSSDDMTHWILE